MEKESWEGSKSPGEKQEFRVMTVSHRLSCRSNPYILPCWGL